MSGLLTVLLMGLGSLIWAPAASAHDELLDLQPGNKVVLSTPPSEVRLIFSAPALSIGTRMRVTGPKGDVVSTGPVLVDQATVVQKLVAGLGDGVYRVDWRVTSADGHPVSGTYTFTIKAAAAVSSPASATGSATSTALAAPASGTATASASPSPAASPSGGTGEASSSGLGSSAGLVIGLAVAATAMVGTVFALVRRRNGASMSNEGNQNT